MKDCKGNQCEEWDDTKHSRECIAEHEAIYSKIREVPSCFDRAEHAGRTFDNCRFIHTCKNTKPICGDNPQ